jgi:spoIIIJ-associated protein
MELLDNGCKVESEVTDKTFNINITGGNVGQVIGKGGEVLNAIQTLVSAIAITYANGENKRVYINAEDYKERRKETLVALAQKKAEKVKATGRYIKLEPMNSRDRAIIHSAVQDIEGVCTYSTGKEPFRCLCIRPEKEGEKKERK